jgi:regulatory protein
MPFKRTQKTYDEATLYEYAVRALGSQMRTVAELKRKMRERVKGQENGEQLIEVVVGLLKEQKYLNDTNYAESYSRFRRDNEKFGRSRVVQDLKAKGVHGDLIAKAVGATYEGVDEEKLARDFLRRKRISKPATPREAARAYRTMTRAGFSSRIIFRILKKWDVDDETITALESEAAEIADRKEDGE